MPEATPVLPAHGSANWDTALNAALSAVAAGAATPSDVAAAVANATTGLQTSAQVSAAISAAAPGYDPAGKATLAAASVAAASQPDLPVTAPITTASTLARNTLSLADATTGAFTLTLPAPTALNQQVCVEKVDATGNVVTISGTIRGAAATVTLALANETITLDAESMSSWRPTSGQKTLSSLDARYAPVGSGGVTYGTTAGTAAQGNDPRIVGAVQAANNLTDLANVTAARTSLGLGTAATQPSTAFDAAGAASTAQAAAVSTAASGAASAAKSADTITDGATRGSFLLTERTKLAGVATNATANLVGTTAGTVAAGNDPRLWAFAQDILVLPSGLTDGSDGPRINAALSTIAASGLPGRVRLAGKYYLNSTVLVLGLCTLDMEAATLRQLNGANLDAVIATPGALTTTSGAGSYEGPIRILGGVVDGNAANQTGGNGYGIFIGSGANQIYGHTEIDRVITNNTRGTGICLTEVNLGGFGLALTTLAPFTGESRITRCRVYNAGANGIWQRGGGLGGAAAMTDGYVEKCQVGYTTHDGIRVDSSGGWNIDACHPYGTGLSGVLIQNAYSTTVSNCYIEGIGVLDSAAAHTSTSLAISAAPAWDGTTVFVFNQVVTSGGTIYKSLIDGNSGNTPSTATTAWAAYVGGGNVSALAALGSNSARPLELFGNKTSLGHASWVLNANFQYNGLYVTGPSTGTSKVTVFINSNDLTNELQPAGTNTTALRLAGLGAGPSGVNSYEQNNAIRGSWSTARNVAATASPSAGVGAGASGGTGATATVTGNNQAGTLAVTVASTASGLTAGPLAIVSYTGSPSPTPRVTVQARDAATAALGPFYVTTSQTGFTINTTVAPTVPAAGVTNTYKFDYVAMIGG